MHNKPEQNPMTRQSYEGLVLKLFIHAVNMNKKYILNNLETILMDNTAIIKDFQLKNVIFVMFMSFWGGMK